MNFVARHFPIVATTGQSYSSQTRDAPPHEKYDMLHFCPQCCKNMISAYVKYTINEESACASQIWV